MQKMLTRSLAPALISGASFYVLLHAYPPTASFVALLGAILLFVSTFFAGEGMRRLFGLSADDAGPCLTLVIGFALIAHLLFFGYWIIGRPSGAWLAALIALCVSLGIYALRGDAPRNRSVWLDVAVSVLPALYMVVWAWDDAPRVAAIRESAVLPFWLDAYIHAGTIAEFGGPFAAGRGAVGLSDTPQVIYHYAPYMVPSIFMRYFDMQPMEAFAGVEVPLGILVMGAGVLALADALGGVTFSLLTFALVAAFPDPGWQGLGNGFFSIAWMLEASPGTGYGVGIACASLALLKGWLDDRRRAKLILAIALAAAIFLVRAHILLWMLPAFAATIIFGMTRLRLAIRWAIFGAVGAFGAAALAWVDADQIRTNASEFFLRYIEFVHLYQNPTDYDGVYAGLMARFGRAGAAPFGLALALLAMSEAALVAFFVTAAGVAFKRRLSAIDLFPFVLLAFAAVLQFLGPIPWHTDFTDLRHRGGTLVTIVLLIWTAKFLRTLMEDFAPNIRVAPGRAAAFFLALLALTVPAYSITRWKQPRFTWGKSLQDIPVDRSLLATADYMRAHADARSSFVVARQQRDAIFFDDATTLIGLSGVPAFLSRPGLTTISRPGLTQGKNVIADETRRRLAVLDEIDAAPDAAAFRNLLARERINWYVAKGNAPSWDPTRREAAAVFGDVAIYGADHR